MGRSIVNAALNRARLRRAPGRPDQVHLAVIDRCFLPCVHCDIWKNTTEDLPVKLWLELIDRLGPWCAPAGMNFVGGEPLMRKDLEQMMARAVAVGFEVSFNTNGWLVTEARAKSIGQAGASIAYVSLDGIHAATIDASRGRAGSFDKAMAAIDRFDALPSPRVVIASVLHGENAAEIPELLRFVKDRELQLVLQPLYQNFGDNHFDADWWKHSALWPKSKGQLADIDKALDVLSAERMRGGAVCNSVAQLQAMKFHFRNPGADNGQTCRAGHTDLSVDASGNIRLCYFLEPVASVFDLAPLAMIWDAPKTLRRRWEVSRCDRTCNLLNCNFDSGAA
jgi:MoaA/NifB/PqqE/SkfB family radical SAM enzyme